MMKPPKEHTSHSDGGRGLRNCYRSQHVSAPCATCGTYTAPVHMPLQMALFYCGAHCPVCAVPQHETEGQPHA
jgi:hypothetical protein